MCQSYVLFPECGDCRSDEAGWTFWLGRYAHPGAKAPGNLPRIVAESLAEPQGISRAASGDIPRVARDIPQWRRWSRRVAARRGVARQDATTRRPRPPWARAP